MLKLNSSLMVAKYIEKNHTHLSIEELRVEEVPFRILWYLFDGTARLRLCRPWMEFSCS